MSKDFYIRVYEVVKKIPPGHVTTYGLIAESLGAKRSARMVGWALNQSGGMLPAHRVVNRNGELTGRHHFADSSLMKELLLAENVTFKGEIVDLDSHLWIPPFQETGA